MTSWPISRRQHPNSIEGFLVVGGLGSVFERFWFWGCFELEMANRFLRGFGLKATGEVTVFGISALFRPSGRRTCLE